MGFVKDGTGVIIREDRAVTTGTLAVNTAILASAQITLGEDFRMLKSEFSFQVSNSVADESVLIGIANGDLTIAEIAECLEVNGPTDRNDRVAVERSERAVWPIVNIGNASRIANDGLPIEIKLRWTFSNPEGWVFFAYNQSDATLGTSMIVTIIAKHFGVWVT